MRWCPRVSSINVSRWHWIRRWIGEASGWEFTIIMNKLRTVYTSSQHTEKQRIRVWKVSFFPSTEWARVEPAKKSRLGKKKLLFFVGCLTHGANSYTISFRLRNSRHFGAVGMGSRLTSIFDFSSREFQNAKKKKCYNWELTTILVSRRRWMVYWIFLYTYDTPHFGRDKTSQADHQSASLLWLLIFRTVCVIAHEDCSSAARARESRPIKCGNCCLELQDEISRRW